MNSKLLFASLTFALLVSCSTTSTQNEKRAVASHTSNKHQDNLAILKSIPLVEGIEKREANEEEIQNELIEIFSKFADRNKNNDGSLNRGTHAKGSCFAGNFTIHTEEELQAFYNYPPELTQRLKQGLFSYDGVLPLSMRFANADGLGRRQSDTISDVRGFSFSITTPETMTNFSGEHRQDFMMNSTPAFASGNIQDFVEIVKAANIAVYKDFEHKPKIKKLPGLLEDLNKIRKGSNMGGNIKSYTVLDYWTNLPYTHGTEEIAKYKVTPCEKMADTHYKSTEGMDPDYLQHEIAGRAERGEVCYQFQVQFYDYKKLREITTQKKQKRWTTSDWIENGGLLWDEKALPFYTVAKIEIPKGTLPATCSDKYINTRLHATKDNLPIGSIARVRTFVEEVSRARRQIK